MPTLTLKFKENTLGDYKIEKGQSLTIGRKDSNDIPIENLAVSGHHAKIDSVGSGYLLTDLKSKNGSFVNKEMVTSHWLKAGDTIVIGKHTLIFSYPKGEKPAEDTNANMGRTMEKSQNRDMLKPPSAGKSVPEEKQRIGVLSYLSGGEGEFELKKKLTKIGKNATSDIVVGGLMMGQTALTISQRPNGYSLTYVEGMSKPRINGRVAKEMVMLREFDTLEIGALKFQFVYR